MIDKYPPYRLLKNISENEIAKTVRQIAKDAKISLGSANNWLSYFEDKKLIIRKKIGTSHQIKWNNENILAKQLKISSTIAEIQQSGLIEEITKKIPQTISIMLYGSGSKGTMTAKSDIDIIVITNKDGHLSELAAENKLSHELSLKTISMKEWKKQAKLNKAYYENIIIDGIALYGEKPVVE